MSRSVNRQLLRKWITGNKPLAKERLALAAEVSVSCVEKALSKKGRAPKLENCLKISRFTGLPLDDLFPEVRKKTA